MAMPSSHGTSRFILKRSRTQIISRFVDAMLDYAGYLGNERTNELLKKRFEAPDGAVTIEALRLHPSDIEEKTEDAPIGGYVLKLALKQAPSESDRAAIDEVLKKLKLYVARSS